MNLFTEIEILSFDRIAFAHSLSAVDYHYALQNNGYGIYAETPENGGKGKRNGYMADGARSDGRIYKAKRGAAWPLRR